jgi:hypothetical protein
MQANLASGMNLSSHISQPEISVEFSPILIEHSLQFKGHFNMQVLMVVFKEYNFSLQEEHSFSPRLLRVQLRHPGGHSNFPTTHTPFSGIKVPLHFRQGGDSFLKGSYLSQDKHDSWQGKQSFCIKL